MRQRQNNINDSPKVGAPLEDVPRPQQEGKAGKIKAVRVEALERMCSGQKDNCAKAWKGVGVKAECEEQFMALFS